MSIKDDELRRILGYDRVAVVGASTSYEKAAHIVPAYLQRHGYEIIPVNPNADEIFGTQAYNLAGFHCIKSVTPTFIPDTSTLLLPLLTFRCLGIRD